MYKCPNCSAALKFDIRKQRLCCKHCNTSVDPYAVLEENNALEATWFETTVFTCSECGGRIISEDTTMATFCSYCGSGTLLESKNTKEKRPEYIIPFTKTKEDCAEEYEKMMQKAIFAPKELKDKANIEKFRGIYMPYWVYSFEKNGPVVLKGEQRRRSGDYIVVKNYELYSDIDMIYDGIAYDAAATFSDNLSAAIGPFNMKKAKKFTPAFLSGFYADTSDVSSDVYSNEALDIVVEDAGNRLKKHKYFRKYNIDAAYTGSYLKNELRDNREEAKLALFPVWFLSYRKNNRIMYAVVNGQTGTVAADLSVDIKKYLLGSLVLALPVFFLFNLFFTIKPATLLLISILLSVISIFISNRQLSRIMLKESGEDDKGLMTALGLETDKAEDTFMDKTEPVVQKKSRRKKSPLMCLPLIQFARPVSEKRNGAADLKNKLPVLIKPVISIIISILILIVNPVLDLYYYGGAILSMFMICISFIDIIKSHNVLTTRRLPQLNKRGGDENV